MWLHIEQRCLTEAERDAILAQVGPLAVTSDYVIEVQDDLVTRSFPLKDIQAVYLDSGTSTPVLLFYTIVASLIACICAVGAALFIVRSSLLRGLEQYIPPFIGASLLLGGALLAVMYAIDSVRARNYVTLCFKTSDGRVTLRLPTKAVRQESLDLLLRIITTRSDSNSEGSEKKRMEAMTCLTCE